MESIKCLVEGIPLSTDYLSVRVFNCLRRAGYFYLSEVIDLETQDLLSIKNMGQQSVEEFLDFRNELEHLSRKEIIELCCFGGDTSGETSNDSGNRLHLINMISIAKNQFVEANDFMCVTSNGIPTEDCLLIPNDFSRRTYNAIKRVKIDTVRDLALVNSNDFRNSQGIGQAAYDEAIVFLNERTIVINQRTESVIIPAEVTEAAKRICVHFERCFSCQISEVSRNILTSQVMGIYNATGGALPTDESIMKELVRDDPIKKYIQDRIIQIVEDRCFDDVSIQDCKDALPFIEEIDSEAVAWLVDDLCTTNRIKNRDGYLIDTKLTLVDWFSMLDDKCRIIIEGRCSGMTLEDIGSQVGLTRERVRQIVNKTLRNKPQLAEDRYSEIYTKYAFSGKEFEVLFNVDRKTIGYLNLVYKKGEEDVFSFVQDRSIPKAIRNRTRQAFRDKYLITESGEILELNREVLITWFLKKYFSDVETTMYDLESSYCEWLRSCALDDNKRLYYANLRSFESNVSKMDNCLIKQGKKVRYFDMASVDAEKLLVDIHISQYDGYEISTYKLFVDNLELMNKLDIRDEYELHNVIRKNPHIAQNYNITVGRMPTICIGSCNRDKQVKDLLYQLSPIGYYDLAKEYEIRYGVKQETVCANYFSGIMIFLDGNVFKVDQPRLSVEEYNRLKGSITGEFYLWDELSDLFISIVGKSNKALFNSLNIKELGYRIYSQYVIRNDFSTADAYFSSLLSRYPCFSLSEYTGSIRRIPAFYNSFRSMRDSLELIEISENYYVSFEYFCSSVVACDKDELIIIGRRLLENHVDDLFTISIGSITNELNPYIERINNVYFYNSLIRIQNGYKSIVIGDVCLVSRGDREPSSKDVYLSIINKYGTLSLDQLVALTYDRFGIRTNKTKIEYSLINDDCISLDMVLETISYNAHKKEEARFWRHTPYENKIEDKYSLLNTSTDRIEALFKDDDFSVFVEYCNSIEVYYMKELLEMDLERELVSLEFPTTLIEKVYEIIFDWVDGVCAQTTESDEIIDLFFT